MKSREMVHVMWRHDGWMVRIAGRRNAYVVRLAWPKAAELARDLAKRKKMPLAYHNKDGSVQEIVEWSKG